MSDLETDRGVRRRLAVLRHVQEVTGNVAMSCRSFGISRQLYYTWLRRYRTDSLAGLRDRSRRPQVSPNATHVEVVGKILYLRQRLPVHGVPTERALRPAAESPDPSIPQLTIRCGRMRSQAESQPPPKLSPPPS